jgi:2-polyprenyl-6-methoxyphenol hydroxylase-like FAD-dependent oxidoreductase
MKTDVIIVGAGPTGLALGCQFIRYGIDFVILDKNEAILPYSRAIGVQARTLEIYQQIGLAQHAIERGAITKRACLIENGKTKARIELQAIGTGLSPFPFLLIFEQDKHEAMLQDYLAQHGKQVLRQTMLDSFTQDDEGVIAQITMADGSKETIEAKYLVGCDGAKSIVRHTLGLSFEGTTFERLFYVADVIIDWEFSHEALNACLAQHALTAFFPMPGENRYRIVGTFPEEFSKNEGEILYGEIEQQIVEDTGLHLKIDEVNWFSVYKVHSRRVESFSKGRCFLAGDAAHIHSPAGAQGMNTGIQDGYNLAWKLASVLKNDADTKILESYNHERSENAKHLLETTDRLFELGSGDHWFTAFFRMHIFPHIADLALHITPIRQFVFSLISQIGIQYRSSPLSDHSQDHAFHVKAGDRMPYFEVDGAGIYDQLHEPCFHLLTFGDSPNDFSSEFAEITCLTVPLTDKVVEIFGVNKPFFVLLRPDNYIGIITTDSSASTIRDYLRPFGCG